MFYIKCLLSRNFMYDGRMKETCLASIRALPLTVWRGNERGPLASLHILAECAKNVRSCSFGPFFRVVFAASNLEG